MAEKLSALLRMRRRVLRRLRDNTGLSAAIIAVATTVSTWLVVENLALATLAENHLNDVRVAMLSKPRPQSRDIAIILINDETLADYPYRSPLDRSLISDLLVELEQRSVAAVGINVLFDRPTEPNKDRQLYQRLRSMRVPVVVSRVSATSGFSAAQIRFSNEFLENIRSGLSLIYRDPVDHTVRGSLLRQVQGRQIHLGFAATLIEAMGMALPNDERVLIAFRPGPDLATPPFPVYPAHQLARIPEGALSGRIVLIGSDLGDSSRLRTPLSVLDGGFGRDLPGVIIEAHILSQLLEDRRLDYPATRARLAMIFALAVIGCLISLLPIRLIFKFVITVSLLPLAWMLAFSTYMFYGTLVPMVAPTLSFLVALVLTAFWQWRVESQKREQVHDTFGRFLAPAVVDSLLSNPDALELKGELREVSFVFTDLEGFTRLTESTLPQQMVSLVNRYLEEACEIVVKQGGTIDKIVGDALHIMFNAPLQQPGHAQLAVECALALDRWSSEFRERVQREGFDLGVTRIGVNTGECVVGNFGGKLRFDYTAHGDTVNTAARLEGINQRLGTTVCISESTVEQCEGFCFRPVATLVLRGKTQGVEAYMPMEQDDGGSDLVTEYQEAYDALRDGDPQASRMFSDLEKRYPDDPLIRLHAKRIEAGEQGTVLIIRKK